MLSAPPDHVACARSVISPFMKRTKPAGHDSLPHDGARLGVLDRPRRHVHGRRRAGAVRRARDAEAAVGRSRPLRGRRRRRHRAAARRGARRRAQRLGRQDGHDGRDERAARAARRADGAGHHGRIRGRHSDRRPAAARYLRARHPAARRCCMRASSAPPSASTRTGECSRRSTRRSCARDLEDARAAGLDSVAIVLLHGYRFPQHELMAAELARSIGFRQVSVSHRVLPLPKLVVRGDTTLADAYLSPVLDRYVASVRRGLGRNAPASARRRDGAALLHAEPRRSHGGGALSRQGQPALGTGRRRRRHGARRARRRIAARSSASTWAARRRTSRSTPASSSARRTPSSRRCASARRCCGSRPSRPAAARSCRSAKGGSRSGRNRRARIRDPRAIGTAGR